MNDRWRTRVEAVTNDRGLIEIRATLSEYLAQWDTDAGLVHVRFHVVRSLEGRHVVAVSPDAR